MENNTNQSGTQNRNQSSNRNQNRNRGGNGGENRRNNNSNNNRNKQGGSNNRNRNRNRSRKPKVIVLTPMQKFIKAITFGAIDPNKKPAKPSGSGSKRSTSPSQQKPTDSKPKPARANSKNPPRVYEVTSPRLYVGNLDYDAGEGELEDLFRGVGNVINAEVVTNSRTQQSKGFAFVEMGSIEEAKRAVEVLHDQEFMSRKLLVSGAKSDGPRDRSDSEGSDDSDESEETD